jgi:uncharacterized protein (DUF58 family)
LSEAGAIPEVQYRLRWRDGSPRPGAHHNRRRGSGGHFRELTDLLQHPDPRRIDLRASARDPFNKVYVRLTDHRSAASVFLVADTSASMSFAPCGASLRGSVIALARTLAVSATQIGDAFGWLALTGRGSVFRPATRSKNVALHTLDELARLPASGPLDIAGAHTLAQDLPRRRALVLIASDFLWPETYLRAVLDALRRHECIPIILTQRATFEWLPRWGLCLLRDLESGRSRLMLLRPGLKQRLLEEHAERQRRLSAILLEHGLAPCYMEDGFHADSLNRHFLAMAG